MNPDHVIHLDAKRKLAPTECEHGIYGFIFFVQHEADYPCLGSVITCNQHGKTTWTIVQEVPLTLITSIRMECEHGIEHGHVTDGKWHRTGDSLPD